MSSAFFDDEEKTSPVKKDKPTPPPSASLTSPQKSKKPAPPPPAPAKASSAAMETGSSLAAQKQHQDAQDLIIRTNRLLAEAVENFSKVDTKEKAWLLEATRNLHALTEAVRAGNAENAQLMKDLMTTVSQQQQTIMRLFEKLPITLPVATTGRARAPAPEVAAPKGLDNESKADRTKRLKKEKEEAAAATASSKKDGADETGEKKTAAGEKRKADASPEREKASAPVASKLKGEHPAEKKQRVAVTSSKKPAQKKKKSSSKSDDESSASSASDSDEEDAPRTPKKKSSRSESPAPTQAQPMDD